MKEWETDYPELPMSDITDEARELAVRWMELDVSEKDWIGHKVKLASDFMNYARRVQEGKAGCPRCGKANPTVNGDWKFCDCGAMW